MNQIYLKDIILDYSARKGFIAVIKSICNQNNIKFPFTQENNVKGNTITPDKTAFDEIYKHVLVRFHNSPYRYCGLKNYPLYVHFKAVYESQGWKTEELILTKLGGNK